MIQVTKAAVRRWLEKLLHTHDTPQRTAAAYALGVFLGFSPFLGLHTVLGLFCAFALNLNRVAVLLGVYSNLPWLLPAYYTVATVGGATLLRTRVPPHLVGQLRSGFAAAAVGDFDRMRHLLWPMVWSYTVGSTLGALILGVLAYKIALAFVMANRTPIPDNPGAPR